MQAQLVQSDTMQETEKLKLEAIERMFRVTNKMLLGRKHPRDYGTGELLYMSEIEIIREVGINDGTTLSELSGVLGVSKATLSPIINKLEAKSYLSKKTSPQNGKIKMLSLTKKGLNVIDGMDRYGGKFNNYMKGVSKTEVSHYINFLNRLEQFLDDVDKDIRK